MALGPLLSTSVAFAAGSDTTFSAQEFTDVKKGSAQYESVEYLRSNNVLRGYLDGTFRPTTRINRAEFAQFIVNPFIVDTNGLAECVAENSSEDSNIVLFVDVQKDAWYADNVCFGKTKKIFDGYPDNTYRPANNINFVEAAKMIANVFSLNLATEPTGEFWYRPYVQHLSERNAIPTSITRFDQTITRGEMAEIVFRLKMDRRDKASTSFSALR